MVKLEEIKKLRSKTGVGIGACKEALDETKGDMEKAVEVLRKKGILKARKRASKATSNGHIAAYSHNGQIGVLVEVMCETDFVARTEKFKKFAKDIALHVAASSPLYLSSEDIPEKALKKEKRIIREKLEKEGKPEKIMDKIMKGQLQKYYGEVCLLDQPYVRDDSKTIKNFLDEAVASFGERIAIGRFVRLELGEDNN